MLWPNVPGLTLESGVSTRPGARHPSVSRQAGDSSHVGAASDIPPSCRRRHRRRDEDGMTLIEAIVALALVAIALLSLLGALMVTARAQHQDKARAFALRLATD